MKYSHFKYYLFIASIAAAIGLNGCSEEENMYPTVPEGEEQVTNDTKLILSVNANEPNAATRATATEMEGTIDESSYNSITVYFTDQNDIIEKTVSYSDISSLKNIIILMDDKGMNLDNPKHIYLIANPTDRMATQLTAGINIREAVGMIENIDEVTTKGHFLMLGQALSNGSKEISFVKGTAIPASVNLTRISAKVLVTTEVENGYIKNVEDGFIKQEKLQYRLQTTNSRFRYLPNAENTDANHNMTDLLERNNGQIGYKNSYNPFLNIDRWTVDNGNKGTIITKRDDTRIESGSMNPYTEGIYCLENTTSTADGLGLSAAELVNVPKMVTTYLRIAAQIIPNKINGNTYKDGNSAGLNLTDGTFYTYTKATESDKKMCYSSIAAAKEWLKSKGYTNILDADFKEFTNGWVYFEVYINGKAFDAQNSSLHRNNYYIVNINKIIAPIVDQTIEINTKITNWKIKGKTYVDIETPTT